MSEYIPRLQEAIASSIRGLGREELLRRPPGKWSVAEILEHLLLSYTGTSKGCENMLASGSPQVTPPTAAQQMKTFVVLTLGYYPTGIPAPQRVVPKGRAVEEVTGGILPQISSMDEWLRRCEDRFGKRVPLLNHPVLSPLTGEQWRKFHWMHGRHHIRQILALREKNAQEKAPVVPGA
jgi:hypothetical protein